MQQCALDQLHTGGRCHCRESGDVITIVSSCILPYVCLGGNINPDGLRQECMLQLQLAHSRHEDNVMAAVDALLQK